ncbi:hypothetical protein QJQ45_013990, partial [Haematococcus lacustris]
MEPPLDIRTEVATRVMAVLRKHFNRGVQLTKQEVKDLDKDLNNLVEADAYAMLDADVVKICFANLMNDVTHEAANKALIALSSFEAAKNFIDAMAEDGLPWLGQALVQSCKTMKGEKQVERNTAMAKMVALYSLEAPPEFCTWPEDLAQLLVACLDRTTITRNQNEAYNLLSLVLPLFWNFVCTPVAKLLAECIIRAGCMTSTFRVAQDVQRTDIKGLPKIVAEKALNLLCVCNSEQPHLFASSLNPYQVGKFCVETLLRCDWVQSQELSLLLLGRLVYVQCTVPEGFVNTQEVHKMLQHTLKCKSPALRFTALCFTLISSQAVFEEVDVEFMSLLKEMAKIPKRSLKTLCTPNSAGMVMLRWGLPICPGAQDALRGSELVHRMAEECPLFLPPSLLPVLSPADTEYVTNIKWFHGWRDQKLLLHPTVAANHAAAVVADDDDEQQGGAGGSMGMQGRGGGDRGGGAREEKDEEEGEEEEEEEGGEGMVQQGQGMGEGGVGGPASGPRPLDRNYAPYFQQLQTVYRQQLQ